eukprot:2299031-Prorocentrum_lima.AAC.1
MVLLFWEKHWTLLPLRAQDPGEHEPDKGKGAVILVTQTPYPGMIEPDGLRGGGPKRTQAQE